MKILIAYDGSESSRAAVTDLRLAGLAHDTQAVVLSVLDGRVKPGEAQVPPRIVEAFERQRGIADDGVACVRDLFPSWEVSAEVRVGAPAWEIIRRAEGEEGHADGDPMDLVVVGSRGFGELKRILLGSVAHRVVTELRCSVRISRGRTERLTADLSKERAAPRLVIGVDGSPILRLPLRPSPRGAGRLKRGCSLPRLKRAPFPGPTAGSPTPSGVATRCGPMRRRPLIDRP